MSLLGSKNVKNRGRKKSTVRENFGRILSILGQKVSYTDLSKNRPHKKHCAWAPTPPLAKSEFLSIFGDFY
jgi:hypothetical protein